MRKVWFAFLLSFLAIWSGNSMDGSKGSFKDDVPMTFVLGTDKNYIVPTLVTIHSLLKNGLKNVNNKVKVNIVALTNQLDESDKKLFCDIFGKITNILRWNKENVGLYFIDIPKDKENEFWYGDFADVDKKLKFFGANVQGKIMPKYKAFLPFCIKSHGNNFGYDTIGTLLPLSKPSKDNTFSNYQHSRKSTSIIPKPLSSNSFISNNMKASSLLLEGETKDSLEIAHYMWLDSDILINEDISNLYQECLGKKAAIGSANYWFVSKDLPSQSNINLGCAEDMVFRDIGIVENEYLFKKKGSFIISDGNVITRRPWRCSGGVMFFNLGKSFFSLGNLKEFLKYGLSDGCEDEETFFGWFARFRLIYAFSPIYNCRPSMPSAAQETSDELKTKQMKVPAELKKITDPKEIAIWHWDGMRKPWQKMYGGFPLIAGKAMSSKYDGLMDADRQWIKEYEEVRLIIKQLKHRFSACLYNFEQMAGKNS